MNWRSDYLVKIFLIQYFGYLCQDSQRKCDSALLSKEMHDLSIGQGLTVSPMANFIFWAVGDWNDNNYIPYTLHMPAVK